MEAQKPSAKLIDKLELIDLSFCVNILDKPCRITCNDRSCFHIFRYNRSGSNDSSIPNRNSRQYYAMAADPYIISDVYLHAVTRKRSSLRAQLMTCCIYANIRTYQAVVSYKYPSHIKHSAVIVGVKIVSNVNVFAKVTMKV